MSGTFGNMRCDRCYKPMTAYSMSFFNTDVICFDCRKKEREHPDFTKAREADEQAIMQGNYNFKGIGRPKDL
jgi:hypothetical protein